MEEQFHDLICCSFYVKTIFASDFEVEYMFYTLERLTNISNTDYADQY